jgi:uncharacterized membrane protein
MNAINVDIVRSLFMPLFLGGTLAAAALAVMAILRWGEPEPDGCGTLLRMSAFAHCGHSASVDRLRQWEPLLITVSHFA